MRTRSIRGREQLVGASLCILYVALLVATSQDIAMSRDESFYVQAATNHRQWLTEAVTDPVASLSRTSIDAGWGYNWEHPALMKLSFALSSLLQEELGIFPVESLAFRFPGMLTAGMLVWLIYVWGVRVVGRLGGLFAALSFALLPRVFYHSHLAAFDVPIAFFVALTAYAYWRSLPDARWAPVAGLAFGLALATKHNSWMLPGIFAVHYAWLRWSRARSETTVPALGWSFAAMLILGPLVLVATWPWVWHDTWARLAAYARFHLQHVHYTYAYLGHSHFEPPFPVTVPFVMTLFTVPLTVIVLAFIGLLARRRSFRPPWLVADLDPSDRRTELLWLGCALAPLLAIALPSSPIFGGTKHWITAYPFVALFAGAGLGWLVSNASAVWGHRCWPRYAFSALCLLPGVVETAHSHPLGLSHYTPLAGGVPGAADLGMNRQFWGFTTGSVADWLAERLPEGGSIWIGDTTGGAWRMMQEDGRIPGNLRIAGTMESADYVLVHHEDHFVEVDFQAWVAYQHVRPAHVLTYDGVPIISIYENPRRPLAGDPG